MLCGDVGRGRGGMCQGMAVHGGGAAGLPGEHPLTLCYRIFPLWQEKKRWGWGEEYEMAVSEYRLGFCSLSQVMLPVPFQHRNGLPAWYCKSFISPFFLMGQAACKRFADCFANPLPFVHDYAALGA